MMSIGFFIITAIVGVGVGIMIVIIIDSMAGPRF